jgi:hypothetical protein
MKVKYWLLDNSRANEVGFIKTFTSKEEVDDYLNFVAVTDYVITDQVMDMVEYCVNRGLDWRKFVVTGEPSKVILLTDMDADYWYELIDKALIDHGVSVVKVAPHRKGNDYSSTLAYDWLNSLGAKMFLYLNF